MNANFQKHLGLVGDEIIKIEELLAIGSNIYYQTHLLPLIKLRGQASEIFLSFKTKSNGFLPVLLNVIQSNVHGNYQLHFAGIQIAQRNEFEKEIIKAKEAAEKALLENVDFVNLKTELESNQRIIEQQLQQISRMESQHQQLDKVLSHDLQEPLRKISFFASMFEKGGKNMDPNITKILESTERLRNLLTRMQRLHALDYQKVKNVPIDILEIVEKAKNKIISSDEEITLLVINSVKLSADGDYMLHLFEELIDNSVKFKHADKKLKIEITADHLVQNIFKETKEKYKYEKYIRITYSDNGRGFENAYSESVFDLFKKLHDNEGLGIGLAYGKRIVELHEGLISVSSKLNKGTTFVILLPIKADNALHHLKF
jgi:sigma-B regulation protein RsbU (phosphoserine phosphatase)